MISTKDFTIIIPAISYKDVKKCIKKIRQKAYETKKFILNTKCNCTYECALTYNILGNWRYQPSLISSLFNLD